MSVTASFDRSAKGKYQEEANFLSIKSGSDAYLLEDEVNELQWLQIEQRNKASELLYQPGVISPSIDNPFTAGNNNQITIEQLNVYYYGLNITIPKQTITLTTSNAERTECLFIEVWLKLIPETTTSVFKYGNQNINQSINVEISDKRIGTPTSQRVQVQTKYSYDSIVDNITDATGSFGSIKAASGLYGETYYKEDVEDGTVINGICRVFPIANIKRTSASITQDKITNIIQPPVSNINNNANDINELYLQINTLRQRLNNLSTEVIDDQKAYGLSMEKQTALYTGYGDNMFNGTPITVTNFADVDNNYCYAVTNLGNHYVGQIGEFWSWINGNKYNICNSGCKNAVFNNWIFKDENEELWFFDTTTAGNNFNYKALNSSNANNYIKMQDWNLNDCIVYIMPRYTTKPSTIPSIGDIYWTLSGNDTKFSVDSEIRIFNTGAADIPIRIFVLNLKDKKNIQIRNQMFNTNTVVNDKYGRHHQIILQNTDYGHTNVLVATPYIDPANCPADLNIGEIYVEQNDNMFMINTTSYGDAKVNLAIFKTAYTTGGDNE